jgi:hypothetical protein
MRLAEWHEVQTYDQILQLKVRNKKLYNYICTLFFFRDMRNGNISTYLLLLLLFLLLLNGTIIRLDLSTLESRLLLLDVLFLIITFK